VPLIAAEGTLWPIPITALTFALITAGVCYPLNQYGCSAPVFRSVLDRRHLSEQEVSLWSVVLRRIAGGLLLFAMPALVQAVFIKRPWSDFGLTLDHLAVSLVYALGGIAVAGTVLYSVGSRWTAALDGSPEMAVTTWDRRVIALNTSSWGLYLAGYEFFFRGFLLTVLVTELGVWPAILITTALYVYSHLPQPFSQPLGALSLGVILAVGTLLTGSLLAAWLIHLFVASFSDVLAVRVNPRLRFSFGSP
jgi:membrane protease YdiL (CAAX protease family)